MPPKESNQNGDMEWMRSLTRFNQKPVPVIAAKPNNAASLIRHLDFFAFHLSIPYMKKVTTLILTR